MTVVFVDEKAIEVAQIRGRELFEFLGVRDLDAGLGKARRENAAHLGRPMWTAGAAAHEDVEGLGGDCRGHNEAKRRRFRGLVRQLF